MLAFLRSVTQLEDQLIAGESISDISLLIISLGSDVLEDEITLLDEGTLKICSLSCLEVKLFQLLGCGLPSSFSLDSFCDLLGFFGVELLNQWFSTVGLPLITRLKFEFRVIVASVSLISDAVRQIGLLTAVGIPTFIFLIDR